MPIYSSDSEDEMASPPRLFNRQRPLYSVLGGGRVADVMLWRNKKLSAAILTIFTSIWCLFEIVEYPFITLLSHILIILMVTVFLWSNLVVGFVNWRVPDVNDFKLSDTTISSLVTRVNWFFSTLFNVSYGNDMKLFLVVIAGLWILSVLGNYMSFLNLLYAAYLCMITLPIIYERYEREVDYLATKGNHDAKKLYQKFSSKVLNKIPRGPVKEKKFT